MKALKGSPSKSKKTSRGSKTDKLSKDKVSKISDFFKNDGKQSRASSSSHQASKFVDPEQAIQTHLQSQVKSTTVDPSPSLTVSDDSDVEIVDQTPTLLNTEKSTVEISGRCGDAASDFPQRKTTDNSLNRPSETTVSEYFSNPNNTGNRSRLSKRLSLKRKASTLGKNSFDSSGDCEGETSEKITRITRTNVDQSQPILLSSNIDDDQQKSDNDMKAVCAKSEVTNSKFEADLKSPKRQIPSSFSRANESEVKLEKVEDFSGDNMTSGDKDVDGSDSKTFRVPYYLQNFETILRAVLDDSSFSCLFDDNDYEVMHKFSKLSDGGKKLYVRMFSRKLKWIPRNKLKYDEIAEDLNPYLKELVDAQFIDSEDKLNDVKEVLGALPAGEIKTLAKCYHITVKVTQKKTLIQELLKKTQQTSISHLFGNKGGGGIAAAMLKSAKEKLKGIYKLRPDARSIFVRVIMLFSVVNTTGDEDSGNGGQQQLFQMLMVNMGKVVYPDYEVMRTHKIFRNRDDVIRFEQALQMEFDLLTFIEKGNWSGAYDLYLNVLKKVDSWESDQDIAEWNTNLPDYLRSFTATSVMYRLLSMGIDIVQRRKEFQEAVELLRKLLSQTTYCQTHRGYWWERLALNLDVHLKNPKQSLEVVKKGLADEYVKVGHRLALFQRAESICQRPQLKLQMLMKDIHHEPVREMPKVFIEGRVLHQGVAGSGPRFLTEGSYANGNAQDMIVCGVEEFVMDYYKKNGFPSSVHAEGSIVSSLCCLFFWDILFMSIPDAFHSPYQAMPLDLYMESFYLRRKDAIDKRIQELKESSVEELCERMEESWKSHHGVLCVGMNWDRIKSLDSMKDLVSCMGGQLLSGILDRYAKCPRHTRSGFPDLTLWNIQTKTFKICEVKGPGDKLSHKQILWIDYLLRLGVDAEVCHVKAVAAKKLKPNS